MMLSKVVATAAGPDQDQEFARLHVDVDALKNLHRLVAPAESLANAGNLERCCHGLLLCEWVEWWGVPGLALDGTGCKALDEILAR